jgi:pSer/pThr/pTyr-binding forkhead associated (FHA) protein
MRDGYTRKVEAPLDPDEALAAFQKRWQATLVLLSGDDAGTEYPLESRTIILGRGESAHLRFDDAAMSSEHAALEFCGSGYRLRDLGSMNGTFLNGGDVKAAELKNGDRLKLGARALQYVLEERANRPRTYEVPVS